MRFLNHNSLPPRFATTLVEHGHEAVHVRERLSATAEDQAIFDWCEREGFIVVAQDTDFATLLAQRRAAKPSVELFRTRAKSVEQLLPMLIANLAALREDLEAGAVAVFEDSRIRVRRLPFHA